MKNGGALFGGIVLGALVGVGVGYLLGIDSEKKQQLLRLLNEKVLGSGCCCCGDDFDCEEECDDDCDCGCKDSSEE